MSEQIWPHILLIGEDACENSRICDALLRRFPTSRVQCARTFDEVEAASLSTFDLVLSHMILGDTAGETILNYCQDHFGLIPILFLADTHEANAAVHLIERGAFDMVIKIGSYTEALGVIVERNLAHWRIQQDNRRLYTQLRTTLNAVQRKNDQLEEAVAKLETVAGTDPLTSLANRRSFSRVLERSFAECNRYDRDLACIMIDLDGFKPLNDTLGHQRGDELLQLVGRVLDANCRRSDLAGRYGGDEFIVLLPQTDAEEARQIAQRICDEFDYAVEAMLKGHADLTVTMSMGLVTLHDAKPSNPEQLIAFADHALYRAKHTGKHKLVEYQRETTMENEPAKPSQPGIRARRLTQRS